MPAPSSSYKAAQADSEVRTTLARLPSLRFQSTPRVRVKTSLPDMSSLRINTSDSDSSPLTDSPESAGSQQPESPRARTRRSASAVDTPHMSIQTTSSEHVFEADLPKGFCPEMVTVSVKRGNRLDVIADLWHAEKDCHYEWEIVFAPRDVDMSTIRAILGDDCRLSIRAKRLTHYRSFST